ncbi:ECF transporter S component [Candidatus Xianfuyuplasma coldseepsis]|uniref:Riboflavin transporter n=1 Tax=Candidatus Xianfuyuplasma coldseepsis TaxID=2782163 RepID=A0A7L7KNR7_9MOLU|nr:ECF transporter S component [Xianfuyuplasma coldseepsis]QMS84287.1 ECF transporter S component [Xianfuyuplasma coldseepsis]
MTSIQSLSQTQRLTALGVLSALATALMYLELPFVFYNFLRIDLSDVVVLLVFIFFGAKEGLLVAFVKSSIHFVFPGTNYTAGVGELAAFLASAAYIGGFYFATNKLNLKVLLSMVFSVVFMSLLMTFANWLFITPLFGIALAGEVFPNIFNPTYITTILSVYIPFNLIKGGIIMAVFYATYNALKPALNMN